MTSVNTKTAKKSVVKMDTKENYDPSDDSSEDIYSDDDTAIDRKIKETIEATKRSMVKEITKRSMDKIEQTRRKLKQRGFGVKKCSFKWEQGKLKGHRCSKERTKGKYCKDHHETIRRRMHREKTKVAKEKKAREAIPVFYGDRSGVLHMDLGEAPAPLKMTDLERDNIPDAEDLDRQLEARFRSLSNSALSNTTPTIAVVPTNPTPVPQPNPLAYTQNDQDFNDALDELAEGDLSALFNHVMTKDTLGNDMDIDIEN